MWPNLTDLRPIIVERDQACATHLTNLGPQSAEIGQSPANELELDHPSAYECRLLHIGLMSIELGQSCAQECWAVGMKLSQL